MHLARKADGRDIRRTGSRLGNNLPNSLATSAPPILRLLLGPAGLGRGEVTMFSCGRSKDSPAFVDEQRAGATGADVDPQKIHRLSLRAPFSSQHVQGDRAVCAQFLRPCDERSAVMLPALELQGIKRHSDSDRSI